MSLGAKKEKRGGDIPNLPFSSGGIILVYLQRGEYSRNVEIFGTSYSYFLGYERSLRLPIKLRVGDRLNAR
jgi:hypothetical protein